MKIEIKLKHGTNLWPYLTKISQLDVAASIKMDEIIISTDRNDDDILVELIKLLSGKISQIYADFEK